MLADRVVMMTNGPRATIGKIIDVKLPRPRTRKALLEHPDYYAYRQEVLDFLANKVVNVARDILGEHGVKPAAIRFLVKNGNPAERIVETVGEVGADAVVMGGVLRFRRRRSGSRLPISLQCSIVLA